MSTDEQWSPFDGREPERPRPKEVVVFVLARIRGDRTDSMTGSLRTGAHGYEAVYTLNRELYSSQWFESSAQARAHLAQHQDALEAAGWIPVPFQP